jgi:uroporphyrin-III C-methyltransferase
VLVSSLEDAAASAQAARIEAPTIIVIGAVVGLRATLDWLGAGEAR